LGLGLGLVGEELVPPSLVEGDVLDVSFCMVAVLLLSSTMSSADGGESELAITRRGAAVGMTAELYFLRKVDAVMKKFV